MKQSQQSSIVVKQPELSTELDGSGNAPVMMPEVIYPLMAIAAVLWLVTIIKKNYVVAATSVSAFRQAWAENGHGSDRKASG